jgi:hypothetical protein
MGNLLGIQKFSYGDRYTDSKVKLNVFKSEINPPQFSWIFHNHDGQSKFPFQSTSQSQYNTSMATESEQPNKRRKLEPSFAYALVDVGKGDLLTSAQIDLRRKSSRFSLVQATPRRSSLSIRSMPAIIRQFWTLRSMAASSKDKHKRTVSRILHLVPSDSSSSGSIAKTWISTN